MRGVVHVHRLAENAFLGEPLTPALNCGFSPETTVEPGVFSHRQRQARPSAGAAAPPFRRKLQSPPWRRRPLSAAATGCAAATTRQRPPRATGCRQRRRRRSPPWAVTHHDADGSSPRLRHTAGTEPTFIANSAGWHRHIHVQLRNDASEALVARKHRASGQIHVASTTAARRRDRLARNTTTSASSVRPMPRSTGCLVRGTRKPATTLACASPDRHSRVRAALAQRAQRFHSLRGISRRHRGA